MPRRFRLLGEEIRRMKGLRIGGRFFTLIWAPLDDHASRAAVVVSRKAANRAVDRNRIKRVFRGIFPAIAANTSKAHALVFHARPSAVDASAAEMKADMEELIIRASRR